MACRIMIKCASNTFNLFIKFKYTTQKKKKNWNVEMQMDLKEKVFNFAIVSR